MKKKTLVFILKGYKDFVLNEHIFTSTHLAKELKTLAGSSFPRLSNRTAKKPEIEKLQQYDSESNHPGLKIRAANQIRKTA